jgi:putative MATE family efflux protein
MRVLSRPLDRRIAALATAALGTLAVEPLYVLVDTAIVGRLGTTPLAGLALASGVLVTVTALVNFLAYGTTQRVASRRGARRADLAAHTSVQALWLAVILGIPVGALVAVLARPMCALLGGKGDTLDAAVTYLRIGAIGLPFVLIALAGMGVMRGMGDLRTPLVIVVVANIVNVVLEIVAVYLLDLGIAGSAWSTTIVQAGAALAYLVAVRPSLRAAPTHRPERTELTALAIAGRSLVLRVVTLIAALTGSTAVAARVDEPTLAAHQIALQMYGFLALALDALAIPAQMLVAESIGAGDEHHAAEVGRRVERLALITGTALGVFLAATSTVLPLVFTSDPDVRSRATAALLMLAVLQPLGGVAFALDGVLIGAADYRFLGRVMALSLLAWLPMALLTLAHPELGIVGVWSAIVMWMVARVVLMELRFRTGGWLGKAAPVPSAQALAQS